MRKQVGRQIDGYRRGIAQDVVSLDVGGNGGARLFAVQASPGVFFDSVTLASDADWAAGQFRYATAAVPEPQSLLSLAAGLAALLILSRKKATIQ